MALVMVRRHGMMAKMKRLNLQTAVTSFACLFLGMALFRLFSIYRDSGTAWLILIFGCATMSAAIGVLLDDVWAGVAVGLWIGFWITALSMAVRP